VDDICDGGRTFIELAKAIRTARPTEIFKDNIFLIVTHGIFSAGFQNLSQYFTEIYCTNSIKDIPDHVSEEFIAEDGTKYMAPVITKVKQLNVFI
jgi:ribose-phosphate pyrophosphokinase